MQHGSFSCGPVETEEELSLRFHAEGRTAALSDPPHARESICPHARESICLHARESIHLTAFSPEQILPKTPTQKHPKDAWPNASHPVIRVAEKPLHPPSEGKVQLYLPDKAAFIDSSHYFSMRKTCLSYPTGYVLSLTTMHFKIERLK